MTPESPDTPDAGSQNDSAWLTPIVLMWVAFFSIGFDPAGFYTLIRKLGGVVTQEAWVNSPSIITGALALYIGWFAYQRCIDVNLHKHHAVGHGLMVFVLGIMAFMDLQGGFTVLFNLNHVILRQHRILIVGLFALKFGLWVYLLSLLFRYYVLGNIYVFAQMSSLFAGGVSPPEELNPWEDEPPTRDGPEQMSLLERPLEPPPPPDDSPHDPRI